MDGSDKQTNTNDDPIIARQEETNRAVISVVREPMRVGLRRRRLGKAQGGYYPATHRLTAYSTFHVAISQKHEQACVEAHRPLRTIEDASL